MTNNQTSRPSSHPKENRPKLPPPLEQDLRQALVLELRPLLVLVPRPLLVQVPRPRPELVRGPERASLDTTLLCWRWRLQKS